MNRRETSRSETLQSDHSVSRQDGRSQPNNGDTVETESIHSRDTGDGSTAPTAHVVLYQPEIPQNTGNVGRTCVAVGAKLWIVRPAGFQLDDKKIRRAGLDYWQHLDLAEAANWDDLLVQLAPRRMFLFSRFAERTIWDAEFEHGDTFVFGCESTGLPESILDRRDPQALRLPTSDHVRSLNLATAVGVTLYEQQRQLRATTQENALDGSSSSLPHSRGGV